MINRTFLYLFITFTFINMSCGARGEANIVHPLYPCRHVRGHAKRYVIINKNNLTSTESNINTAVATPKPPKTWQVGRVSRKQFEIINMLWRKTKIFGDINEDTTASIPRDIKHPASYPIPQSSTASFIEFYYLDEVDDRIKRRDFTTSKAQFIKHFQDGRGFVNGFSNNLKLVIPSAPMFAFHVNGPNYKRPSDNQFPPKITLISQRKSQVRRFPVDIKDSLKFINALKGNHNKQAPTKSDIANKKDYSKDEVFINTETCPATFTSSPENTETPTIHNTFSSSSTIYDKIKFFEMYDQNTVKSNYAPKNKYLKTRESEDENADNKIMDIEQKISLNQVDQIGFNHDEHHKTKYVKKHIIESFDSKLNHTMNATHKLTPKPCVPSTILPTMPKKASVSPRMNASSASDANRSKTALWSEYSFAAVYIHEAAQVHCDAAGISPHWLVAAGSCLSRHQKNTPGQGRSAFVAYCGSQWWPPERVAYVKYTIVHPRFHHRDKIRKHLYNIGVIQVVSSMASACTGWAPISLMSHQFAADQDGSNALAIGWGLDRYDTRYASTDLPKWPLKIYKSLVFSDSCPGSISYSKAKRQDDNVGVKNVYCLSLPPYGGEENDPVHGSVLLAGGKLIALYLQEERRPWGEQCAQYTGTWRLTPWVLNLAREPDDGETFSFDI